MGSRCVLDAGSAALMQVETSCRQMLILEGDFGGIFYFWGGYRHILSACILLKDLLFRLGD